MITLVELWQHRRQWALIWKEDRVEALKVWEIIKTGPKQWNRADRPYWVLRLRRFRVSMEHEVFGDGKNAPTWPEHAGQLGTFVLERGVWLDVDRPWPPREAIDGFREGYRDRMDLNARRHEAQVRQMQEDRTRMMK